MTSQTRACVQDPSGHRTEEGIRRIADKRNEADGCPGHVFRHPGFFQ